MEAPERAADKGYWHCHCLLIEASNGERLFCTDNTGSPDRPFCDNCEGRHQNNAFVDPSSATVSTYKNMEEREAWQKSRQQALFGGAPSTERSS